MVHIFGKDGARAEAERLGTDYLGDIPIDPKLRESGDEGEPLVIRDPESPVTEAFLALAEEVRKRKPIPTAEVEEKKKGLFSFLKS